MRIGIIHGAFTSLGGAERVAISLIKSLKDEGHEINIYFTDTMSNETLEDVFGNFLTEVKVHKVFQLKIPIFGIYRNILNRMLLTNAGDKNDVIIETSGYLDPLWFTSKPYIAYCNGLATLSSQKITNYGGWRKLYGYAYSKLYALARSRTKYVTIVSNSKYTQELVKKIVGIDSQVIYPPVEINLFKFERVKTEPKILMLSRFAPEKNYELAVKIAELLSDQRFIFAGSVGDPHYYEKLNQSIAEKGISQRIEFVPNAPVDVLRRILSEAKVYLHCRYDEPFGITVVEAIAAGCIPIVPDRSAHKETVPFEELRFSTLEEAIEKVKSAMEGLYDTLVPKLQEHINQFDEKTFRDKMRKLIESKSA